METFGETYVRETFRYSDGKQAVCADPIRLKGELHIQAFQRGLDIDKSLDAIERGSVEEAPEPDKVAKWESAMAIAELVATVFKVPYTEELGPDVTYNLSLLDYFYEYLEKKNPPLVWRPTSSPSSESPSMSPSLTSAETYAGSFSTSNDLLVD